MRRSALLLLAALLIVPSALAQEPLGFEDDWSSVLRRIVQDDGLVAYADAAGSDFDRARAAVETFDASRLTTDDEKLAFWINAYNVKMVEAIAGRPNARNLEKQNLFEALFKSPVTVAGREVTLDQIEHVILRRQDGPAALEALAVDEVTPLIHVGLNCAAVSCPPLRNEAYRPVDAEPGALNFRARQVRGQLQEQAKFWVQSERFLRIEDGEVVVSSLVDWFGTDFDFDTGAAGDFFARAYSRPMGWCGTQSPTPERLQRLEGRTAAEIKAMPNVRFDYDWTVARAGR